MDLVLLDILVMQLPMSLGAPKVLAKGQLRLILRLRLKLTTTVTTVMVMVLVMVTVMVCHLDMPTLDVILARDLLRLKLSPTTAMEVITVVVTMVVMVILMAMVMVTMVRRFRQTRSFGACCGMGFSTLVFMPLLTRKQDLSKIWHLFVIQKIV